MRLAIVGGGTAGWLTALYAKKMFPGEDVFLIESEEIGILGAGEGTTPHLVQLFNFLQIPFSELVKNCGATVKNGIKFTNWSENEKYFFHPFASTSEFGNDYNFYLEGYLEQDTGFSHICSSKFNHGFNDYAFVQRLSNNFSVPFIRTTEELLSNPMLNFQGLASWSLHFNANVLAKYLRGVAESRGIKRIEGIVKEIKTNENEYITSLIVNDSKVEVDFVFDCSGFRRLIIGNFYKSKWKSHSEYLPAKKAIPFFLPQEENIPPYTESTAMNFGWMWKIPLQERYGCGYVFDSDFISEDEAKDEIEKYLGFAIDSPKTFSFSAGSYEEIWIKNCLAVGLSSGFIEPLEATSLWQLEANLKLFFSLYKNVMGGDESARKIINERYNRQTEEIVNFIYLHYVTDKKNTEFWKDFTKNNKMPSFISNVLEIIKERPLNESDFFDAVNTFGFTSYYYVLIGNGIITKNILKKYLGLMKKDHTQEYLTILKNQNIVLPLLTDHKEFLRDLKL